MSTNTMESNGTENKFVQACQGLSSKSSDFKEEYVGELINLWTDFYNEAVNIGVAEELDKHLESLLICTARLIFNFQYSKSVPGSQKLELKNIVSSCGEVLSDNQKKLCCGISSIVESPWNYKSYNNAMKDAKPRKNEATELWETEGWIMLETRIDYLVRFNNKKNNLLAKACSTLHILVSKGHELFHQDESCSPLSVVPVDFYKFSYTKYVNYLEIYAMLCFDKKIDTQIFDQWEEKVMLDVITSLLGKPDDESQRLFSKLKVWSKVGDVIKWLTKNATLKALRSSNSLLVCDLFMKWMQVSKCGSEGVVDSTEPSPLELIGNAFESIPHAENIYKVADKLLKTFGPTVYIRQNYVTLFLEGLRKDLAHLEQLKNARNDETEKITHRSKELSIHYLELAKFFKEYPKTAINCVFTAFTFNPCFQIFYFLFPENECEIENVNQNVESESGDRMRIICNDLQGLSFENCSSTAADNLGLDSEGLETDILNAISNPCYKGFLGRKTKEELKDLSRKLLDSTSVTNIENKALDHLEVDFEKYKDFKSQYDPDDDGIENGFRPRRRRVLGSKLISRNILKGSHLKANAIKRARRLPVSHRTGIVRKGRPPKPFGMSAFSLGQQQRQQRQMPNISLDQCPWSRKVFFYEQFVRGCFNQTEPVHREEQYKRRTVLESTMLKIEVPLITKWDETEMEDDKEDSNVDPFHDPTNGVAGKCLLNYQHASMLAQCQDSEIPTVFNHNNKYIKHAKKERGAKAQMKAPVVADTGPRNRKPSKEFARSSRSSYEPVVQLEPLPLQYMQSGRKKSELESQNETHEIEHVNDEQEFSVSPGEDDMSLNDGVQNETTQNEDTTQPPEPPPTPEPEFAGAFQILSKYKGDKQDNTVCQPLSSPVVVVPSKGSPLIHVNSVVNQEPLVDGGSSGVTEFSATTSATPCSTTNQAKNPDCTTPISRPDSCLRIRSTSNKRQKIKVIQPRIQFGSFEEYKYASPVVVQNDPVVPISSQNLHNATEPTLPEIPAARPLDFDHIPEIVEHDMDMQINLPESHETSDCTRISSSNVNPITIAPPIVIPANEAVSSSASVPSFPLPVEHEMDTCSTDVAEDIQRAITAGSAEETCEAEVCTVDDKVNKQTQIQDDFSPNTPQSTYVNPIAIMANNVEFSVSDTEIADIQREQSIFGEANSRVAPIGNESTQNIVSLHSSPPIKSTETVNLNIAPFTGLQNRIVKKPVQANFCVIPPNPLKPVTNDPLSSRSESSSVNQQSSTSLVESKLNNVDSNGTSKSSDVERNVLQDQTIDILRTCDSPNVTNLEAFTEEKAEDELPRIENRCLHDETNSLVVQVNEEDLTQLEETNSELLPTECTNPDDNQVDTDLVGSGSDFNVAIINTAESPKDFASCDNVGSPSINQQSSALDVSEQDIINEGEIRSINLEQESPRDENTEPVNSDCEESMSDAVVKPARETVNYILDTLEKENGIENSINGMIGELECHVISTPLENATGVAVLSNLEPNVTSNQVEESSPKYISNELGSRHATVNNQSPETIVLDTPEITSEEVFPDKQYFEQSDSVSGESSSPFPAEEPLESDDEQSYLYDEACSKKSNPANRPCRPITPVEELEELINKKLKKPSRTDKNFLEKETIKVAASVVNHQRKNNKPLRNLLICVVKVEALKPEELPERSRQTILNPMKRSTRLKEKKNRTVDIIKSLGTGTTTETNETSDTGSEIEFITEIHNPNQVTKRKPGPKSKSQGSTLDHSPSKKIKLAQNAYEDGQSEQMSSTANSVNNIEDLTVNVQTANEYKEFSEMESSEEIDNDMVDGVERDPLDITDNISNTEDTELDNGDGLIPPAQIIENSDDEGDYQLNATTLQHEHEASHDFIQLAQQNSGTSEMMLGESTVQSKVPSDGEHSSSDCEIVEVREKRLTRSSDLPARITTDKSTNNSRSSATDENSTPTQLTNSSNNEISYIFSPSTLLAPNDIFNEDTRLLRSTEYILPDECSVSSINSDSCIRILPNAVVQEVFCLETNNDSQNGTGQGIESEENCQEDPALLGEVEMNPVSVDGNSTAIPELVLISEETIVQNDERSDVTPVADQQMTSSESEGTLRMEVIEELKEGYEGKADIESEGSPLKDPSDVYVCDSVVTGENSEENGQQAQGSEPVSEFQASNDLTDCSIGEKATTILDDESSSTIVLLDEESNLTCEPIAGTINLQCLVNGAENTNDNTELNSVEENDTCNGDFPATSVEPEKITTHPELFVIESVENEEDMQLDEEIGDANVSSEPIPGSEDEQNNDSFPQETDFANPETDSRNDNDTMQIDSGSQAAFASSGCGNTSQIECHQSIQSPENEMENQTTHHNPVDEESLKDSMSEDEGCSVPSDTEMAEDGDDYSEMPILVSSNDEYESDWQPVAKMPKLERIK